MCCELKKKTEINFLKRSKLSDTTFWASHDEDLKLKQLNSYLLFVFGLNGACILLLLLAYRKKIKILQQKTKKCITEFANLLGHFLRQEYNASL